MTGSGGAGRAGELVPLADRLRYTQLCRLLLAVGAIAYAAASPHALTVPLRGFALVVGVYAAVALAGHGLWHLLKRGGIPVFGGLLIADGLFLAVVSNATGGSASPLRYLIFVHLVAVALLASYRTGLKLALWHSILLWMAYQLTESGVLEAGAGAARAIPGSELERLMTFATMFWVVALVTASFSAVNERELRRRRYDLEALAEMARRLEDATESLAVADVLLEATTEGFGFERASILSARDGEVALLASRGPVEAPGRTARPSEGSVLHHVLATRRTLLVNAPDSAVDGWLTDLFPGARNLVLVPLSADAEAIGVLVVEHAMRSGSRIERRVVSTVERFASHGALALRNAWLLEQVQKMADTDGLTHVANRRTFDRTLERELSRAARSREDLSLILFDIDHFKSLNDTYGHQTGDEVLRRVADTLSSHFRDFDTVARYGGEEFAVILPRAEARHALEAARRFLSVLREDQAEPRVTASAGVASFPANAVERGALISAADAALYEAKEMGRDQAIPTARWTSDLERANLPVA